MKKYIPKEYCTDVQTEFVEWILCPVCRNKTRIIIRKDTVLENFPLYCPKCKQETLISNMIYTYHSFDSNRAYYLLLGFH